jgi:hypothetical protein
MKRRMGFGLRAGLAAALLAAGVGLARPARAEPTAQEKTRAASLFDRGVARFNRADYEGAARDFLAADDAAPSADALDNAIASARHADDQLLVAEAAQRALAREPSQSPLAAKAREALAQAAPKLARVELDCDAPSCHTLVDAQPVAVGTRYLLPGTHTLSAVAGDARATRRMNLEAGATYRVELDPVTPAPTPSSAPSAATTASRRAEAPRGERPTKPLSPAVFYVGAGVTVVLAGLTTWSGLDALSANRALPARPTQNESDDVHARMHRTDALLAGAIVVGAATAYAGIELVDWGGGRHASAMLAPVRGGGILSAAGRF